MGSAGSRDATSRVYMGKVWGTRVWLGKANTPVAKGLRSMPSLFKQRLTPTLFDCHHPSVCVSVCLSLIHRMAEFAKTTERTANPPPLWADLPHPDLMRSFKHSSHPENAPTRVKRGLVCFKNAGAGHGIGQDPRVTFPADG